MSYPDREKIHVSIGHRLGKSEKFRPAAVIVKFVYLRQTNIVWEARPKLRGSHLFIKGD